jgi:hypothetical protein
LWWEREKEKKRRRRVSRFVQVVEVGNAEREMWSVLRDIQALIHRLARSHVPVLLVSTL